MSDPAGVPVVARAFEPGLQCVLEDELATWPAARAGAAVVGADGPAARVGDDGPFAWASVTKLLTALVVLDAVDREVVGLDDPAGPPGATLRHLLAHTSGLAFDDDRVRARPATRRIYSNRGFEVAAQLVADAAGQPFARLLRDRVLDPLGMTATTLEGSPAHGARGTVTDLARLAGELLTPVVVSAGLLRQATTTAFPGLAGALPGYGRHSPNDWGLGFELRAAKQPHWTSPLNTPSAFGHFGQSGAFLWVDPVLHLACVSAADLPFGPWALPAWPRLSTRVVRAAADAGLVPAGAVSDPC